MFPPSQQCSSTPVGLGEWFLSKELRDNIGASPTLFWPVSSRFLPVTHLKSAVKGKRFCDATDLIKNATEELKILLQNFY
jgi:hypothetical protein